MSERFGENYEREMEDGKKWAILVDTDNRRVYMELDQHGVERWYFETGEPLPDNMIGSISEIAVWETES